MYGKPMVAIVHGYQAVNASPFLASRLLKKNQPSGAQKKTKNKWLFWISSNIKGGTR